MAVIKCKIKSYIQPFEKTLALRELASLSGSTPVLGENEDGGEYYFVKTSASDDYLANKLSYWESVQSKFTIQVLREATVNVVRNSVSPEQIANKLPHYPIVVYYDMGLMGFMNIEGNFFLNSSDH
jgi:hypothetical protein